MDLKEAQARLEAAEKALANLQEQKDRATVELQVLQNERSAAVRRLAAGGGSPERKKIWELQGKIEPLALRLDGVGALIEKAQAALKAESAEYDQALAAVKEKQVEVCKQICAELLVFAENIFPLYAELCDALKVSESMCRGVKSFRVY